MSDQITYDDKADLIVDTTIDDMFKVSASDMNEIKRVVNDNAEEVDNKLGLSDVLNEASTDTDKPYSADYLNDKLVSVGATAPENGERVWFKKSKNLFNINSMIGTTQAGVTLTQDTNGKLELNGTPTNTGRWRVELSQDIDYPITLYLKAQDNNGNIMLSLRNSSATQLTSVRNTAITMISNYTPTSPVHYIEIAQTGTSASYTNYKFEVMVVKGTYNSSTIGEYEPYVELSINVDEEEWYRKSGWTNRTNELIFNDSNANTTRTFLFVNETLRLVYLQVCYNAKIASTTIAKPIQYPLKYKPAFVESDRLWFSMSPANGGSYTARGSIQYNGTETFINILCASNTISSPYGTIIYPY